MTQNPIRESCVAEQFTYPAPRKVPMITAVSHHAIHAPLLPLLGAQQTDHALVIFGHTYAMCQPHLLCAGEEALKRRRIRFPALSDGLRHSSKSFVYFSGAAIFDGRVTSGVVPC